LRILIITNHFWPENFRITDLAVGFRERGHEVSVLTGVPDYPEGRYYPGYGVIKRRFEQYRGVNIARFPLIPRRRGRALQLALNYFSSAVFSCLFAPFYCRKKFDVIFVFGTSPITIGLSAIVMKRLRSIPMVFWVLDLWPESLSATGAVRSSFLLRLVRRMMRFIHGQSDRILISSRGFVGSILTTGGYEREIVYFPNWVEPEYLQPKEEPIPGVLPKMPEGFRVMFAGNIGAAQDFGTILNAAERLSIYPDIHWVIVGDGRMADWVRSEVSQRNLEEQFHLLGRYPAEMMPRFFDLSDALLVTLKREPIFALTVPGKLQSYMACGKPIIAGLDGEGASIVQEAEAGLTCPAESPVELADQVMALYRMSPEERREMGENGRRYCLEHFERTKQFDALEKLMTELILSQTESIGTRSGR
jgi:glycosyltransferase involved in cell wall biosynthesis